MPVPRSRDPELRKLERELSRRMWGHVFALLLIGLIGSLLILGAVAAVKAVAAPFTPELRMAYNMAVNHWGGPPERCSSVELVIVPNAMMPEHEGEATQPEPGEYIPCNLFIRRELAKPTNFIRACAVMRHEVGHLKGHGHHPSRRHIMYERIFLLPSACWDTSLWLLNRPRYGKGAPHYDHQGNRRAEAGECRTGEKPGPRDSARKERPRDDRGCPRGQGPRSEGG